VPVFDIFNDWVPAIEIEMSEGCYQRSDIPIFVVDLVTITQGVNDVQPHVGVMICRFTSMALSSLSTLLHLHGVIIAVATIALERWCSRCHHHCTCVTRDETERQKLNQGWNESAQLCTGCFDESLSPRTTGLEGLMNVLFVILVYPFFFLFWTVETNPLTEQNEEFEL
jgi:hypothetical protein